MKTSQHRPAKFERKALPAAMALIFGHTAWAGINDGGTSSQLPTGGNPATPANVGTPTFGTNSMSIGITGKAIIDWATFNIGDGYTLNFTGAAGAGGAVLNRVAGGNAANGSTIGGALNGTNLSVMLMNPNGVAFTSTAAVNVGALVATTGTIDHNTFLTTGNAAITGATGGITVEAGARITATGKQLTMGNAGLVALVAPSVVNDGVITAVSGKILLAGAQATTISMNNGLYEFAIGAGADGSRVENTGTLTTGANPAGNVPVGTIVLSAPEAAGVLSGSINLSGIQRANRIEVHGNVVELKSDLAASTVAGSSNVVNVLKTPNPTKSGQIQDGIDIAKSGGLVEVGSGNFDHGTTLRVNKPLTLQGAGQTGIDATIIDASDVVGYGVLVTADHVTLSNFTLLGPAADRGDSYGIKVQPSPSLPGMAPRLQDFKITDVTGRGAGRAELDLNGVVAATIDGFTADGASTKGAGIQITDSASVEIKNSVTMDNLWGGVALYQSNRFYDQQVDNITVQASNSFGEKNPLYLQDESASRNFGALNLLGFDYAVRNPTTVGTGSNQVIQSQYTWMQKTAQGAFDLAVNLGNADSSYAQAWNGTATTQSFAVGVGHVFGSTATRSMLIQTAVDRADPGAEINIFPGRYTETASGRTIPGIVGGVYNIGLLVNKDNLTLRGVDAAGEAITNADGVQAWITAGARSDFGMAHGVVANNVTFEGLGFKPKTDYLNKTIEISGDNFTFRNSLVDNRVSPGGTTQTGGAAALYFGELDPAGHQSTKLTVTGSKFYDGSIVITNGVGAAADDVTYQAAADRLISGNTFIGSSNYKFGGVLLNGKMDEIGWRVDPIGAVTISDNTFSGFDESVLVRGEQQGVDLKSIMLANTFDHSVLVTDASGNVRGELYGSSASGNAPFFMRPKYSIQSNIQAGINRAVSGDTVTVGEGTYAENLTIGKSVLLQGAGIDQTYLRAAVPRSGDGIKIRNTADVAISGVTIADYATGLHFNSTSTDRNTVGSVSVDGVKFDNNRHAVTSDAYSKVDGFSMTNSSIRGGEIGVQTYTLTELVGGVRSATGAFSGAEFENVTVEGPTFKGFYFETANNLLLKDVTISDAGNFGGPAGSGANFQKNGNAIDINLKYDSYGSIVLDNVKVEDSGYSSGYDNRAAVIVKTRGGAGDATYAARPATLENLTIIGGSIESSHTLGTTGVGLRIETLSSATGGKSAVKIEGGTKFGDNGKDIVVDGTPIDARGAVFTGVTNGFQIEDRVDHALDHSARGLVTWQAGNVYVTQASGSVQRAVDATSVGDTVNVAAATFAENVVVNQQRNLLFGGSTVQSLTINAGSGIGGTVAANTAAGFEFGAPVVLLSNTVLDTSAVSGRIAVDGVKGTTVGGEAFTVLAGSGAVDLADLGTGTRLGATEVIGGAIHFTGSQYDANSLHFTGPMTLSQGATFKSNGGAALFEGAVNGTTVGGEAFTVLAGSGAVDLADLGTGTRLGATNVTGGAIHFMGSQYDATALHFTGPMTLSQGTTFKSNGGAAIFEGAVNGTAAGVQSLTVLAGSGAVDLADLGTGTRLGATNVTGGAIHFTGSQYDATALHFTGPMTLSQGTTFKSNGGAAIFEGAVNGTAAGVQSLTVLAGSGAVDLADLGTGTRLGATNVTGGAIHFTGSQYDANSLHFTGPMTLSQGTTFKSNGGAALFEGAVNGTAAGVQSFTVLAGSGTVDLGDLGASTRLGATNVTGGAIHFMGSQYDATALHFTGPMTLSQGTTFKSNGGAALFEGAVNGTTVGSEAFTVLAGSGTVELGNLGASTRLGETNVTGGAIHFMGSQYDATALHFTGPMTLSQGTTFKSNGGAALFEGAVNGTTVGSEAFTVLAGSGTVELGDLGASTRLGATNVTGGAIHFMGSQYDATALHFTGPMTLSQGTTFKSNGGATIFEGAVNGTAAGVQSFTVLAGSGAVDLADLGTGTRLGATNVTGGAIHFTGSQYDATALHFTGPMTLSQGTTFKSNGGATIFEGAVNGTAAGVQSFTVLAGGGAVDLADLGTGTRLGATNVTGGAIHFMGSQYDATALHFTGPMTLSQGTTFKSNGGAAIFEGAVNGTAAGVQSLTVLAGSGAVDLADLGTGTRLGATNVTGGAIHFMGSQYDATALHFTGPMTLSQGTTFKSNGGAAIFEGAVNGTAAGVQSLTVLAGSGAVDLADLGTGTRLGATNVTGGAIHFMGSQYDATALHFTGPMTLSQGTTFKSNGGAAIFEGAVNGTTVGSEAFTVLAGSGTVELGNLGASTRLGETNVTGGAIHFMGSQYDATALHFTGPMTLSQGTTFKSNGGAALFEGAVNGTTVGSEAFTVLAGSGTVELGNLGASTRLGETNVTGGAIHFMGSQYDATALHFTGPMTLSQGTTFKSNGGAALFEGAVNGTTVGSEAFTVLAGSGTVELGDLGASTRLGATNVTGGAIHFMGSQYDANSLHFTGPMTLSQGTTFKSNGGAALFEGAVNGTSAGVQSFAVLAGSGTVDLGNLGASTRLGATNVTGGAIHFMGSQYDANSLHFTGPMTLSQGTTFKSNGGAALFEGAVNGTSAGVQSFAVLAGSGTVDLGNLGASTRLGATNVTGGAIHFNGSTYFADSLSFSGPAILASPTTTFRTNGGNIVLDGDIQNADGSQHALTLDAGLGDVTLVSGGSAGNPLGALEVNSNNFTLLSTLWVSGYDINAFGTVALSDHTLRSVGGGVVNEITAGRGVTGSTIAESGVLIQSDADVAANVTSQGGVVVEATNVSGNYSAPIVAIAAQDTVNVTVNATVSVQVDSGGPLILLGEAPVADLSSPGGQVHGNFGQVTNSGSGLIDVNGKPQVNTTISGSADNLNKVIPAKITTATSPDAAGPTRDDGKVRRRKVEDALEVLEKGEALEIDLTPG